MVRDVSVARRYVQVAEQKCAVDISREAPHATESRTPRHRQQHLMIHHANVHTPQQCGMAARGVRASAAEQRWRSRESAASKEAPAYRRQHQMKPPRCGEKAPPPPSSSKQKKCRNAMSLRRMKYATFRPPFRAFAAEPAPRRRCQAQVRFRHDLGTLMPAKPRSKARRRRNAPWMSCPHAPEKGAHAAAAPRCTHSVLPQKARRYQIRRPPVEPYKDTMKCRMVVHAPRKPRRQGEAQAPPNEVAHATAVAEGSTAAAPRPAPQRASAR